MLLELLVVVTALTGCFAGVLALGMYIKDRKLVREGMDAIREIGKAASDPAYVGGCIAAALTHDVKLPDGTAATVPNIIQGLVEANLPTVKEWLEGYVPQLIALASTPSLAKEMQGKSTAAKAIAKLGGGLKGAQALQHGMKAAAGPLAWLGQLAEAVPALIQLKDAIGQMKGTGGDGGSSEKTDWRPPV